MSSTSSRGGTLAAIVVAAVVAGATVPAQAAEPVHIDADETIGGSGSTFTSTIEGCESGTVSNGPFRVGGGPGTSFGKFNGFKVFECADGGTFVVRLLAKFNDEGSTGTWASTGPPGSATSP